MDNNIDIIETYQSLIQSSRQILPCGGKTKTALSTRSGDMVALDISHLSGIIEYEPEEFTISIYAGTRVSDVLQVLDENDQYLAFDPQFVTQGATLGGVVGSGLSGSGRYHYGGVRDFILGVHFINADGEMIRGGGKVVKNAAGFDLPKLMVGSLGSLGLLVRLTFKVIPKPERSITLRFDFTDLADALEMQSSLFFSPLDVDALDILTDSAGVSLYVRLAGFASALKRQEHRLVDSVGSGVAIEGQEDEIFWSNMREFTWVKRDWKLVKVSLTPSRVLDFDTQLDELGKEKCIERRYSCGCQVCWVAIDSDLDDLNQILLDMDLVGLVILGPSDQRLLGSSSGLNIYKKIRYALDPLSKFAGL